MAEKQNTPEIRFEGFTDPWEQRKLGNCGTTYGGLTGKTKKDFGHGNARFIPYTNVFDNPLTDTKRLEAVEIDSSQNQVVYGDVFFTVSSETPDEVGMSSVWLSDQEDVYLNSFCFGYRQDSTFDPHYLAYMLRSSLVRSNLTLLAQGISRFNISKNKVMELSVPVPSVVEQKQLGQYFTKLDSLITLHQRKYDKLCTVKKSMLDKMFPKPGETEPEVRFKGFTDPWEQRKLGEFGSVAMCKRIYKEQTSEQGDVPFFKIGTFGTDPDAFISNELFDYFKRTYPYPTPGTLLISAAGSIGRVVEYQGEKAYFQDSNIVWLEHDHRLNDTFLKPLYSQIEWGLEGSTIKRLYNKDLLSAEVTIPGSGEQKEIGRFFAKLDNLITLHQRKLDLLKNTKKSLLDKMFV